MTLCFWVASDLDATTYRGKQYFNMKNSGNKLYTSWAFANSSTGNHRLTYYDPSTSSPVTLNIDKADFIHEGSTENFDQLSSFANNKWLFVAIRYSGDNMVYLNGGELVNAPIYAGSFEGTAPSSPVIMREPKYMTKSATNIISVSSGRPDIADSFTVTNITATNALPTDDDVILEWGSPNFKAKIDDMRIYNTYLNDLSVSNIFKQRGVYPSTAARGSTVTTRLPMADNYVLTHFSAALAEEKRILAVLARFIMGAAGTVLTEAQEDALRAEAVQKRAEKEQAEKELRLDDAVKLATEEAQALSTASLSKARRLAIRANDLPSGTAKDALNLLATAAVKESAAQQLAGAIEIARLERIARILQAKRAAFQIDMFEYRINRADLANKESILFIKGALQMKFRGRNLEGKDRVDVIDPDGKTLISDLIPVLVDNQDDAQDIENWPLLGTIFLGNRVLKNKFEKLGVYSFKYKGVKDATLENKLLVENNVDDEEQQIELFDISFKEKEIVKSAKDMMVKLPISLKSGLREAIVNVYLVGVNGRIKISYTVVK